MTIQAHTDAYLYTSTQCDHCDPDQVIIECPACGQDTVDEDVVFAFVSGGLYSFEELLTDAQRNAIASTSISWECPRCGVIER